jgi:hypothetical protein
VDRRRALESCMGMQMPENFVLPASEGQRRRQLGASITQKTQQLSVLEASIWEREEASR